MKLCASLIIHRSFVSNIPDLSLGRQRIATFDFIGQDTIDSFWSYNHVAYPSMFPFQLIQT